MSESDILERLSTAVIEADEEAVRKAAEDAISAKIDPIKAIREGLGKGMAVVGEKFGKFEVFLPSVMLAADAMKAGMTILRPHIALEKFKEATAGKVVIATMFGDIHDLGKNIVVALLEAAGFTVYDLGIDVKPMDMVKKAQEVEADIIAMSCLLTTCLYYQRDVVKELEDLDIRGKYYTIIGGGATEPEWAKKAGVDAWGLHAEDGVEICKRLMTERPTSPLKEPMLKR